MSDEYQFLNQNKVKDRLGDSGLKASKQQTEQSKTEPHKTT
jgi:hypothetical protein